MRKILMINVLCLVSLTTLLGQTVENRIAPPVNYIRETCDEHSFTSYLRQLPLLPKGSKVVLYNGQEKRNQAAAYAVIDMEIGNRDLQQCADAIMRLRAEYLWAQKDMEKLSLTLPTAFPQNTRNGQKETGLK